MTLAAEIRSLLRMRMGRRPRAEALEWAMPLVDAYMTGFARGDYTVASAGFAPALRESFDRTSFLDQRAAVMDTVGAYHSHAVQAVHRQGAYVLVVVLVFFERERKAVLRALFDPSAQQLVGVWLASPKLKRR